MQERVQELPLPKYVWVEGESHYLGLFSPLLMRNEWQGEGTGVR